MTRYTDIPHLLLHYLDRIRQVRRAPLPAGEYALHKPVLLLTLIDLVEALGLQENRFPLAPVLFSRFDSNWRLLVDDNPAGKIYRPLFHLQSDGLWTLVDRQGRPQDSFIGSKKTLLATVAFGKVDDNLFPLLRQQEFRQLIRLVILEHFFPERMAGFLAEHPGDFYSQFTDYEMEALLEPRARYGTRTHRYEGFLRDLAFRRHILRLYGNTCAISGLRVFADVPMIEAAHITPFSASGDNAVTNGLALCPNLHRAFDWGLIGLTDSYEVIVPHHLRESDNPFQLRQFSGQRIRLPAEARFHPDPERLRRHREWFGL